MAKNIPQFPQPQKAFSYCLMCEREISLTKHHLIPVSRHKNKRIKARFGKEELQKVIHICRECHNQIHALITEKEMAETYYTLESLVSHEGVSRFIQWVKKHQPSSQIRTRRKY